MSVLRLKMLTQIFLIKGRVEKKLDLHLLVPLLLEEICSCPTEQWFILKLTCVLCCFPFLCSKET